MWMQETNTLAYDCISNIVKIKSCIGFTGLMLLEHMFQWWNIANIWKLAIQGGWSLAKRLQHIRYIIFWFTANDESHCYIRILVFLCSAPALLIHLLFVWFNDILFLFSYVFLLQGSGEIQYVRAEIIMSVKPINWTKTSRNLGWGTENGTYCCWGKC